MFINFLQNISLCSETYHVLTTKYYENTYYQTFNTLRCNDNVNKILVRYIKKSLEDNIKIDMKETVRQNWTETITDKDKDLWWDCGKSVMNLLIKDREFHD
jgi:hypothetical protein